MVDERWKGSQEVVIDRKWLGEHAKNSERDCESLWNPVEGT